ncbi:MAG: DNA topoisomerase IV, partial [Flavobacteriaceae bacterium]|nr:DNA topoisomerase IV [Flavobacteriaceae bacterium]
MKNPIAILVLLVLIGCESPQRNCQDYKNGQFTYTATINGEEKTTVFKRNGGLEIAIFEGVTDSSSVKWINDCEYILKNLNPKTKAD